MKLQNAALAITGTVNGCLVTNFTRKLGLESLRIRHWHDIYIYIYIW